MAFIIIVFLIIIVFFIEFFILVPLFARGIFFVPINKKIAEEMVKISNIKPGDKTADFGSGDGRVVIALAKTGAESHGYEINPLLVYLSRRNIRKAGLENKAFIHWKNFWDENCSSFDVIILYQIGFVMENIENKLKRELKPGGKVISYYFTFPTWQHSQRRGNIYLYENK